MLRLWRDLRSQKIRVVFTSGRHLESILNFYEAIPIGLRADACICMVGTEIWQLTNDSYRIDRGWSKRIARNWDREQIHQILNRVPGAVLQPREWQSPYKISYFLSEASQIEIENIRTQLSEHGLQAKLVYSANRFLDALPPASGKGEALSYLTEAMGVPADKVITAGDTGNDLDMMRPELGFRSIAVGNAAEELRRFRVPSVYHASAAFAAGVREGLEHYGWLTR